MKRKKQNTPSKDNPFRNFALSGQRARLEEHIDSSGKKYFKRVFIPRDEK